MTTPIRKLLKKGPGGFLVFSRYHVTRYPRDSASLMKLIEALGFEKVSFSEWQEEGTFSDDCVGGIKGQSSQWKDLYKRTLFERVLPAEGSPRCRIEVLIKRQTEYTSSGWELQDLGVWREDCVGGGKLYFSHRGWHYVSTYKCGWKQGLVPYADRHYKKTNFNELLTLLQLREEDLPSSTA